MLRLGTVWAAGVITAVALAACGSSGKSTSSSSSGAQTASSSSSGSGPYGSATSSASASNTHTGGAAGAVPPPASGPAKVALHASRFGPILVDAHGRALYLWQKDKGGHSACAGACAKVWPALVTHGAPQAGTGVKASLLGTTSRAGGVAQVTYNGHPLYYFTADAGPGQTNGEGSPSFGALWDVVSAAGAVVPPEHTVGSSSSSAQGY